MIRLDFPGFSGEGKLQPIAFKLAVQPGRYTISIVLRSVTNPGRLTTLKSRPFSVAAAPAS